MPRSKEQFDLMKNKRRDSILESALILYALNGDKLTIDQIAKKAHCSHGIVYHYFKNVDEISSFILNQKEYKDFKNSLRNNTNDKYQALNSCALKLLDIKDIKQAAMATLLLKERGKNSLYEYFLYLIKEGQLANAVVGGDPKDIAMTYFNYLSGQYLNQLYYKKSDFYRPNYDNVLKIIFK